MLMASIVASMMMGGFVLTITGDVGDDDLTEASDDADVGNDLYADDAIGGVGGLEGWGDLLTDLMEDDSLYGGPEAVNSNALVPEGPDMGSLDEDALLNSDLASLLDDNITEEMETLFGGPWTTDGTEVLVYDFVPARTNCCWPMMLALPLLKLTSLATRLETPSCSPMDIWPSK